MTTKTALRLWREGERLTRAELAEKLDISESYLRDLEQGASCSLPVAARIEKITAGFVTAVHLWADHERQLRRVAARTLRERKRATMATATAA